MARDRSACERARDAVAVGKIAGPSAPTRSVDPGVEEDVCAELGPAAPRTPRRRSSSATATPSSSARVRDRRRRRSSKIATEIRHLQRTEVREAEEPFGEGQKGSSRDAAQAQPDHVRADHAGWRAWSARLRGAGAGERGAVARARHLALLRRARHPPRRLASLLDYMLHLTTGVIDGTARLPGADARQPGRDAAGSSTRSGAAGAGRGGLIARGRLRASSSATPCTPGSEGGRFRETCSRPTPRHASSSARRRSSTRLFDPARYLAHVDDAYSSRLEDGCERRTGETRPTMPFARARCATSTRSATTGC